MSARIVLVSALMVLLSACVAPSGYYGAQGGYARPPSDGYARCQSCGVVERIDRVYGQRQSSGGGAILGGIVGAIVGNQIGSGSGRAVATMAGAIAGGAAFLGHLFPVWLGFKGGKGVATFFGLILAACWPLGLMAAATWLIMAFALRYSSLSALVAAALTPLYALLPLPALGLPAPQPVFIMAVFTALLIFIRHHENIGRLLKGAEPKIGAKKT